MSAPGTVSRSICDGGNVEFFASCAAGVGLSVTAMLNPAARCCLAGWGRHVSPRSTLLLATNAILSAGAALRQPQLQSKYGDSVSRTLQVLTNCSPSNSQDSRYVLTDNPTRRKSRITRSISGQRERSSPLPFCFSSHGKGLAGKPPEMMVGRSIPVLAEKILLIDHVYPSTFVHQAMLFSTRVG